MQADAKAFCDASAGSGSAGNRAPRPRPPAPHAPGPRGCRTPSDEPASGSPAPPRAMTQALPPPPAHACGKRSPRGAAGDTRHSPCSERADARTADDSRRRRRSRTPDPPWVRGAAAGCKRKLPNDVGHEGPPQQRPAAPAPPASASARYRPQQCQGYGRRSASPRRR